MQSRTNCISVWIFCWNLTFSNTQTTHIKKDAEFIPLHDDATSASRFKCYNTSNDKIQQLYADTNKLHKCLNFLLELNIFKNTNNTRQKMQNSSLYTITPVLQPDSNATIHQTTRFSNCMQTRTNCISVWIFCWNLTFSNTQTTHIKRCRIHPSTRWRNFCKQIQMLQYIKRQDSATVCRHEQTAQVFEFFARIKHFQKHKQHTSKDAEFNALHDHASSATRFKCYNTSNDKIQQLYADSNKLHKCLNFLLELNIFKHTNNTHQKVQNSSLYTMTQLLQADSNATIHQTTRFSN